jgi:hypothetical protein
MIIIPFIHKVTNEKDMNVHSIRVLTVGGKDLWEESKGSVKKILESNGIYSKKTKKYDNVYLCEVDTVKTDINDIYKWNELDINDNETFCWRDYVFLKGKNNECWLQYPKNEMILKITEIIKGI